MTNVPHPEPHDGELLSAYLSGDLGDADAAALEERLAHDADLARRLDVTARVLLTLRGVDAVEPPPDAGERLRRRLAAEGAAGGGEDGVDDEGVAGGSEGVATPAPPVTTLAARRRGSWQAVAGIAAGLAAFALVGGVLVQGLGDRAGDETAADAPDADMQIFSEQDDAQERALEGGAAAPGAPDPERAAEDQAAVPESAPGPVIIDDEVALEGLAGVRARYREVAEETPLVGEPLADAEDTAAAMRAAISAAPAFRSGHRPDACLDAAGEGEGSPIPIRVESALVDGQPAVVYVLVTAKAGSTTLDRVEARVLSLPGCALLLTAELR